MLNIVMGTSASGKSRFIMENFPEWEHFSVGEYQRRIRKENSMSRMEVLLVANEQIKCDVAEALRVGKDVVMEHTLYKAKRRIGYVETFRMITDEPINIYVMQPSDEQLINNLKAIGKFDALNFEYIKNEMGQIEMPNISEGYDKIFVVTDGVICEYMAPKDDSIVEVAREDLAVEKVQMEELIKRKEAKEKEFEQLIDKLEEEGFWHYCEGCGAKEKLNSKKAFEEGWDYPGKEGIYKTMPKYGFGIVAPRTCGKCGINKSMYWKRMLNKNEGVNELTEEEVNLWGRIMLEPQSLIE